MKKLMGMALVAAAGAAAAQDTSIPRSEYPCAIVLCLADPRGARAEGACRPPIDWLYSLLRRGKGFPHCAMERDKGNYIETVSDYYDRCPPPLQPAPAGSFVAQGRMTQREWRGRVYPVMEVTTTPSMSEQRFNDYGTGMGRRACVGNALGTTGGGDDYGATVYDTVQWLDPQGSGRAIDVYSGNAWQLRVWY